MIGKALNMSKKAFTAIITATRMEAAPFIQGMNLKNVEGTPLPLFQNENLLLVISGIGKTNAAMAATFCCLIHAPGIVFNLGAAGALDETLKLGEILQVSRIVEPDRPRPDLQTFQPMLLLPDIFPDFKSVTLATQDKPVLSSDERKEVSRYASLADMEAASILEVCRKFETPCHVFKFVSDTPGHESTEDIMGNIRSYRAPFFEFIRTKILDRWFQI
jgi:adenosylhomocysteine nucleosidase